MMERFSSLVTKSRPWPVIGRTIFFTSDKNRPTRDEIYFIDFWRENLSMYRINRGYFMVGECGRFFFTSCERRERTSERSERVSSATPRNE